MKILSINDYQAQNRNLGKPNVNFGSIITTPEVFKVLIKQGIDIRPALEVDPSTVFDTLYVTSRDLTLRSSISGEIQKTLDSCNFFARKVFMSDLKGKNSEQLQQLVDNF